MDKKEDKKADKKLEPKENVKVEKVETKNKLAFIQQNNFKSKRLL